MKSKGTGVVLFAGETGDGSLSHVHEQTHERDGHKKQHPRPRPLKKSKLVVILREVAESIAEINQNRHKTKKAITS